MFDYRDVDEGEQIEDRLMIPLDALELAVQGGWKMGDFVSDLKGESGEQAKEVADLYLSSGGFLLTPNFWVCLGRALRWAGSLPIIINGEKRIYPRPSAMVRMQLNGQAQRAIEQARALLERAAGQADERLKCGANRRVAASAASGL